MLLKTSHHCVARCIGPSLARINHTRFLSIKVAVVGSGPGGFYTTQKLLKNPDVKVDIYERLPVPFGLVRYGVAPDHAEVKNVIKSFTSVANNDRVNFYGNVSLGDNIRLDDLMQAYHAVVLCYGSAQDKTLNIEGEKTTKNTISARDFVGWYNGLPENKDLDINLDCDTACIIGQGNVALDCARILMRPANIEKTDITSYAQQMINSSKIKQIYIIGRRGPVQVSFLIKELREMIRLNDGRAILEPSGLFKDQQTLHPLILKLSRQRRRLTELLMNSEVSLNASKSIADNQIQCIFKFFSKPIKIVSDPGTGRVSQLHLQRTAFDSPQDLMDENAVPTDTDQTEIINCGLVIRSIGYKAVVVDKSLPIDHKLGAILNVNGRVQGYKNLYCSGWLATGASGVIAGTLQSSHVTSQSILEDIHNSKLPSLQMNKSGFDHINSILRSKDVQVVRFNDWLRIDELERRLGETLGKTREKYVDIGKMLEVAGGKEN